MEDLILPYDKMQELSCHIQGNYKLYLFKPTLLKLFPKSGKMHAMTFTQRLRFFSLLFTGYRVYVLSDKGSQVLGCAVFATGGSYRYPFSNKEDLICGPYYTVPTYRNQGIASKLLTEVIEYHETNYKSIYAHIWYENEASIRCMSKIGFKEVGRMKTSKFLHICKMNENGNLILVSFQKKENKEKK